MSLITLDFETPYRTRTVGDRLKYTLRTMTYEQYIRDPRFRVMGVGIKVDAGKTSFYRKPNEVKEVLHHHFAPKNENIMLAHNTPFDGAILSWHFGLFAATYWDTMGMSNAIWPQYSAALDALTKRLFPNDPTKWKGKELANYDGYWPEDMTEEDWVTYGGYCANDVDITFDSFKEMWPFFPARELEVIDMTVGMFVKPTLVLDRPAITKYHESLLEKRSRLVRESGLPQTTLASAAKFAAYLKKTHNIEIPVIASPTKANPDNTKLALAKTDLDFIALQKARPELDHLWKARICVTSTGEVNRCERLLLHAHPETNVIAVPLKYYGAHTGRWSGTNKVNFQNFKRKSPIRTSLYAPEGFNVLVRDLANIEGRVNAWFNQQHDKCDAFKEGRDLYNEIATDIFGYKVDRKAKVQDAHGNYLNSSGQIVEYDDAAYLQFMEGFTGKTAELGLGYGMGANKFCHQCAVLGNVIFEESFGKKVVKTWREKNYKIVAGWRLGDRAIFDMASPTMTPYEWGPLTVARGRLILPNGLALTFPKLKQVTEEGKTSFTYWNGKFYKSLYGGLLMENIIQALSRIIMAENMLDINQRIAPLNGRCVLTSHDEVGAIAPIAHSEEAFAIMGEVMSIPPVWANDGYLTLTSEGGIAANYSK